MITITMTGVCRDCNALVVDAVSVPINYTPRDIERLSNTVIFFCGELRGEDNLCPEHIIIADDAGKAEAAEEAPSLFSEDGKGFLQSEPGNA